MTNSTFKPSMTLDELNTIACDEELLLLEDAKNWQLDFMEHQRKTARYAIELEKGKIKKD